MLSEFLAKHVAAGAVPGAVAMVGADDARPVAAGSLQVDSIVRIQSMTKVITAVAALRLVSAGRLTLESDVSSWLPELAAARVLTSPTAELDDTVPLAHPMTLRHLLTNTSGYGMILQDSPLQRAMAANGTEAGPEPPALGASEWLSVLAGLPLAFQPGEGWRYHHSFALLGILLSRVVDRPLGEHLAADLFEPFGLVDTAFWVPDDKLDRLPAAYRHTDSGLVETEPAGAGFYAGPPPFDVSHAELVSTARDFHRFARLLATGALVSADQLDLLSTDLVDSSCKTPESFFPGFWDGMGWGFGVGVQTTGEHAGRVGWSGGQGTDFYLDPDGTVAVLLTQVELGPQLWPMVTEFQEV